MPSNRERSPGWIDKGFELDRKLNVAAAIGATAVGILVPAVAVPAALVAGGSVAAIPISDRLKGYADKLRGR